MAIYVGFNFSVTNQCTGILSYNPHLPFSLAKGFNRWVISVKINRPLLARRA